MDEEAEGSASRDEARANITDKEACSFGWDAALLEGSESHNNNDDDEDVNDNEASENVLVAADDFKCRVVPKLNDEVDVGDLVEEEEEDEIDGVGDDEDLCHARAGPSRKNQEADAVALKPDNDSRAAIRSIVRPIE